MKARPLHAMAATTLEAVARQALAATDDPATASVPAGKLIALLDTSPAQVRRRAGRP